MPDLPNYRDGSMMMNDPYPRVKSPMDVNDHPDDHNRVTEHEDGKALGYEAEPPHTTETRNGRRP